MLPFFSFCHFCTYLFKSSLRRVNAIKNQALFSAVNPLSYDQWVIPRQLEKIKGELYARLWDAYDKLEYTERMMLAQRLGFCFECHSTFYMDFDDLDEYGEPKKKSIKPMMYTDIATDHEYSSANTAHKKCEKALAKLKEAIKDLI